MTKLIELTPIKQNWAISNQYRIKLMKLTHAMLKDILLTINEKYEENESVIESILQDSNVTNILYNKIQFKFKFWNKKFKTIATKFAMQFVDEVDADVTRKLNASFTKVKDFMVVKFSETDKKLLIAKESIIKQNVDLITNIPQKCQEQITFDVTEAISRGRDHKYLEQQLRKTGEFTERRVKLISRDQIDKATSVINHARQVQLGITKNKWVYTNISKEPRQSHKHANGKIYEIEKGCENDGKFIYPGELINCKCISAPVIEFD